MGKRRTARKAKPKRQPPVSAQLFAAVIAAREAGWPVYKIAAAAGVPQSTLQQWIDGTNETLSQKNSNALCAWLGMRLTEPRIPEP